MSGIKCGSVSIQADASFLGTAGGEFGIAFSGPPEETRGFVGGGGGGGLAVGTGLGLAFGMWTVKPKDLKGRSYVIGVGVSGTLGLEVQVNFDKKWRFIGIQVLPQAGFEIEVTFSVDFAEVF